MTQYHLARVYYIISVFIKQPNCYILKLARLRNTCEMNYAQNNYFDYWEDARKFGTLASRIEETALKIRDFDYRY